jgi:serine/threonine protein phosphatase 1
MDRLSAPMTLLPSRPGPAYEGAGRLIYAVGDVHGRADLLLSLLDEIASDADSLGRPARVVLLGDLVNRGPQSREVLDLLLGGPSRPQDEWVVLRGNHDQLMLDALRGGKPTVFASFLAKGGAATLASYGLPRRRMSLRSAQEVVPAAHLDFLESLPLLYCADRYLFVHAGVEPGKALEQQTAKTLMTIRHEFLEKDHGLPFTVVHGHTPTPQPVLTPFRIGIDTGASSAGILTCVALGDGEPRFIQVSGACARALRRVAG